MNRRGSALVETAFGALLASSLMAGGLALGRASLASRRAGALARYAAALAGAGAPAAVVGAETDAYARRLGGASYSLSVGRFDRSAAARFYRMVEATVAAAVPFAGSERRLSRRAVVEQEAP